MNYLEAEVIPEIPPEAMPGSAEASAPLAEDPSGSLQTYSSAELAGFFGVSDRSIRTWIKKIRESWYSLEPELMLEGRYTIRCYELLADYKACCSDGSEPYEDYRHRAWEAQKGVKPSNSSTAIALAAHRGEAIAVRQIQESSRVLEEVKEDLRVAYHQQPSLAKSLAKKFAANFKEEFAREYSQEIGKAIQEVTQIGLLEE